MSITPSTSVSLGNQQLFTAVITGKAPSSGLTYHWSLSGPGSLAGGNPVVTTAPSVVYTAPTTEGSANLSLKIFDSAQKVLANASIAIPIVTTPSTGSLTITNSFPGLTGTGYDGTYVMPLTIKSIDKYGLGLYNCEMMFSGDGYTRGGQQFLFFQQGLAGSKDYFGTVANSQIFWVLYQPGSTFNNSPIPTELYGTGTMVISNVKDDGKNTSFSFSFHFSNSSGSSTGSGTFIIQDNQIGTV